MRRVRKRKFPWAYTVPASLIIVIGLAIFLYNFQQQSYGFPFPCLPQESLTIHIHPYLRIIINGQNVTIPAAIGIINPVYSQGIIVSGTCFEPLHTHDASGIIHIESPSNTNYTLGDFFKIWSATYHTVLFDGQNRPIMFNSTNILGFKADMTHKVVLLVDGKPSSQYQNLVLNYYDYCSSSTTGPPCYPTAVGDPYYGGTTYPYGTGHTIVIEYVSLS